MKNKFFSGISELTKAEKKKIVSGDGGYCLAEGSSCNADVQCCFVNCAPCDDPATGRCCNFGYKPS